MARGGALFLLLAVACTPAPTASPPPSVSPPPVASASAGADAGPPAEPSASQAYTRDVWVVTRPPSPVFLLAKFEEPAGEGCEARLMAHARSLGANRLYIDTDVPCGGSAYFERQAPPPSSDANVTLRGNVRSDSAINDWVRARWKRPGKLTDAQSKKLCVVVQFTVSPVRRVLDVRGQPIRSSGDAEFDESVRVAIESAIAEHATVPMPPRDLVGEVVSYRIEFTEGDPRLCRQPKGP